MSDEVDFESYTTWRVKFSDGSECCMMADNLTRLLYVLNMEIFQFDQDEIVEIEKGWDY